MEKEKMLLVLSVLEGRHFPKRVPWQLTVEGRFDGEVMVTDPIDHLASPDFNAELAWEVDRRGLNVLKRQRTPVKVQCYAQNKKSGEKESVGYIVLDLTLAQHPTMKPKWFPILNSKYREKPEMLLSLGLEDDRLDVDDKPILIEKREEEKQSKKEFLKTGEKKIYNLDDLVPTIDDEGEYYQIGPADECKESFTFSVTVGFASNLDQLIPSDSFLPDDHEGFFFYYLLLGNEIYTDPFPDLSLSNFAAERATVELRSNLEALRSFFSVQSKIQVHLCCGVKSLGSAEVPLDGLVGRPMTEQTITIENSYELKTSRQSQMTEVPEALKPTVGIVLTLKRKIDSKAVDPVVLNSSPEIAATFPKLLSPPSARRNLQYPTTPPQKLGREPEIVTIDDTLPYDEKLSELPITPKSDRIIQFPKEANDASSSFEEFITYSFCIDLRTVKNISVETPFNCFVRYSYSYFGDVAPMLTHPAVDVRLGCSSILPHGYATFSFMTKPKHLEEVFRKNPIRIEILHKDVSKDRDVVVGSSLLQLGNLLDSEKSLTVDESGKSGWRRSVLSTLPVISNESHRKVAEIQLFTALDDFGPALESEEIINTQKVQSQKEEECNTKIPSARQETLEDRLAEQAALEIEKWKEVQETTFLKQLKERETKHMEAITSEWTQRETERELLLQRKLSECQTLEDKLKKAIDNVEKKERELIISDAEGKRMKTDLQLDYERRMLELKDTARRLKEEFEHKTELEKNKTKAIQDQCVKFQRQLSELEKKLAVRDAEFQAYRDTKTHPEVRLQSELNLLKIENTEMERRINSLTKSKVHYKQQYIRSLRELARIKQAMQSEAQTQLRKQQQELEQMRTQIIASEQQENLFQQRQVIENLKSDLQRMTITNSIMTNEHTGPPRSLESKKGIFSSKIEETQLAHLMEERETLLRTGLYSQEDQIIEELDRQIARLAEQMNR